MINVNVLGGYNFVMIVIIFGDGINDVIFIIIVYVLKYLN